MQMTSSKQHEFNPSSQKAAKLTWTATGWIVRYPGPRGEVCKLKLTAAEYEDAFDEANMKLTHEPETQWIIA